MHYGSPGFPVGRESKKREAIEPLKNYYPTIIDEETFWEVQRLLDGRLPKYRNDSKPRNVLAGLARCPLCGSAMYRKGRGTNRQQVLICSTALNGGPCLRANVNLEVVKQSLQGMIDRLLLEMPSGSRDINKQLEHIEREIEGIDAREEALVDTLANEVLSEPQRAPILKRLGALQDRRGNLQKAQQALWKDSANFAGDQGDKLADKLTSAVKAWSILEVNQALRSLFAHIDIHWPNQRLVFLWRDDPKVETGLPLFFSHRVIKGHQALINSGASVGSAVALADLPANS